jgi:hypothetical protein
MRSGVVRQGSGVDDPGYIAVGSWVAAGLGLSDEALAKLGEPGAVLRAFITRL